jgi:3-phenylpropionate/trans-cinnamate dioxygenase alpha subunit
MKVMADHSAIVDLNARTVEPQAFIDAQIYAAEQENIFSRCWLYLGHESQLQQPGDFITSYMGEEAVIVWRGSDGKIRAFLNSCRHRGMKVCRTDEGNSKRVSCPYHGWTYSADGRLVGVPDKQKYGSRFNADEWGLIEVPRLDMYAGLIFGSLDAGVVSLDEYLGEIKWYLDTQFRRTSRGRVVFPGVQKWTLDINWKIGAEQFAGDNYHAPIVHSSAARLGLLGEPSRFARTAPYDQDFEIRTTGGHGWINLSPSLSPFAPPEYEAYEAAVREAAIGHLSPKQADLTVTGAVGSVFPNFGFISFQGGLGLRLWQPKGVNKTDLWIWTGADAEAPKWRQELSRTINIRYFSAAGLIDIDDSEMWLGVQKALGGVYRRKFPLNYQLGAETGRRESERPGLIDSTPSEVGIFGFWERWKQLMSSNGCGANA